MDLSPDLARKLLTRDFANLAPRVQLGGNLSRTERAILQGMATSSGPAQATVADTYVELAGILGVTRRRIQQWCKRPTTPKLLAEVEEREFRLAVKMREYVSIEEVNQT
jgi:hypothetical protein